MAHFFVASALLDHQCKTPVGNVHLTAMQDLFQEKEQLCWSHSGKIYRNTAENIRSNLLIVLGQETKQD